MRRLLTAIFAVLLTLSGATAVPVSRIDAGRDSSAIVWLANEQHESAAAAPARPIRNAAPRSHFTARLLVHRPLHSLFQRPPPR
jgi:hypothetical protein